MGKVESGSAWARWAAQRIREAHGDAETPLVEFLLPQYPGVRLIFKDESTQPSGSLKHRLAASLIMFGVCNGDIDATTTLVDTSSGSTAVSEAFFARELGLRFIAVVPGSTSPSKLKLITDMGGTIEFVEAPADAKMRAQEMGSRDGYLFLDQFSNASVQTNWRSGNLASALFQQFADSALPLPDWVVVGAGTGGTAATFARYSRYIGAPTRIAVADPENSAYYPSWLHQDRNQSGAPSRIEGIGRPTVEPSFIPQLIDEVLLVLDVDSVAAMRHLASRGIHAGPSTGTNLIGALRIAARMHAEGRQGLIASLICDSAERYQETYLNPGWLDEQGISNASVNRATDALRQEGLVGSESHRPPNEHDERSARPVSTLRS